MIESTSRFRPAKCVLYQPCPTACTPKDIDVDDLSVQLALALGGDVAVKEEVFEYPPPDETPTAPVDHGAEPVESGVEPTTKRERRQPTRREAWFKQILFNIKHEIHT